MPFSTSNTEEALPSLRNLSLPSILNVIVFPYRQPSDCPLLNVEILEIIPNCDESEFSIGFMLSEDQEIAWLTPTIKYSVNGGTLIDMDGSLGVSEEIGPFESGDVITIIGTNPSRPECLYISPAQTHNCFVECPTEFPATITTEILDFTESTWKTIITFNSDIADHFSQAYYEINDSSPQILDIGTLDHEISDIQYTDNLKIYAIPLLDGCPILSYAAIKPAMIDPGFNSLLNDIVNSLAVQADGKVVISGRFTAYGVTLAEKLTRLNSDGTLDTAFNTAMGSGLNGRAWTITVMDSGRIICTGNLSTWNGQPAGGIIVLTSSGTRDTTFLDGTGFDGYEVRHKLDSEDNILVAGHFGFYNGIPAPNIIKLLGTNGTKHPTFNPGTGGNHTLTLFDLDPSDRSIMMNYYGNSYDGNVVQQVDNIGLFRANSNGGFDSLLAQGTKFNETIYGACSMDDGSVIVVGTFTQYNGSSAPGIVKLLDNGAIDTTFMTNIGTGFNTAHSARSIFIEPTTQDIFVGCNGVSGNLFDGSPTKGLVKLSSSGIRDTLFLDGSAGFNGIISIIRKDVVPNGLVVGGNFTQYNGNNQNFVAKISY